MGPTGVLLAHFLVFFSFDLPPALQIGGGGGGSFICRSFLLLSLSRSMVQRSRFLLCDCLFLCLSLGGVKAPPSVSNDGHGQSLS